jgi:succinate-semialdehyde dehydrogenase/glutarate-semialdehyde dehydrogenase
MVQDSILTPFLTQLTERVQQLKVGPGIDPESDLGPLINEAGLSKVQRHIQDAVAKGAKMLYGGRSLNGLFHQPTILTNVTEDMLLTQEETFGPVLPILTFSNEAEAIRIANNTPYGLAAYFYTQHIARVWRVSEALEFGVIGANDGAVAMNCTPFGGV